MPHMPIQLMPSGRVVICASFVVMVLQHHMSAARRGEVRLLEPAIAQILRSRAKARDPAVGDDRDRSTEMLHLLKIVRGEEDRFAGPIKLREETPELVAKLDIYAGRWFI